MSKIIWILAIFFLASLSVESCLSQQVIWERKLGGPLNDFGWNAFQTRDGGFLMVGEKTVIHLNSGFPIPQTYLVKLDFFGNIEWQKSYGDSLMGNYSYSALEDDFGNFYVPFISDKAYLMKISPEGNLLWYNGYGDSVAAFFRINFTNSERNLVLTGETFIKSLNYWTASLTKIDTSGNYIWTKSYYDTIGFSGVYTMGGSPSIQENFYYFSGAHRGRGCIVKTDLNGNMVWDKLYSIVSRLYTIIEVNENEFISSGYHYCQKTDTSGNLVWQRSYGNDTLAVFGFSIARTYDNNFAIVGSGPYGYCSIFFIDKNGNNIHNSIHYYEPQNLIGYNSISECSDSGYIIAGDFRITDQQSPDVLLVKTNANGKIVNLLNYSQIVDDVSFLNIYPNPFNNSAHIEFNIIRPVNTKIEVYNILGQSISLILSEQLQANRYNLKFSFPNLPSGIYFLVIRTDNESKYKKFVIQK